MLGELFRSGTAVRPVTALKHFDTKLLAVGANRVNLGRRIRHKLVDRHDSGNPELPNVAKVAAKILKTVYQRTHVLGVEIGLGDPTVHL